MSPVDGNFRHSAALTHSSAAKDYADPNGEMGMMDFLTTPDPSYGVDKAERTQDCQHDCGYYKISNAKSDGL